MAWHVYCKFLTKNNKKSRSVDKSEGITASNNLNLYTNVYIKPKKKKG